MAVGENTAVDPAAVVSELLRLLPSRQIGMGRVHVRAVGRAGGEVDPPLLSDLDTRGGGGFKPTGFGAPASPLLPLLNAIARRGNFLSL